MPASVTAARLKFQWVCGFYSYLTELCRISFSCANILTFCMLTMQLKNDEGIFCNYNNTFFVVCETLGTARPFNCSNALPETYGSSVLFWFTEYELSFLTFDSYSAT